MDTVRIPVGMTVLSLAGKDKGRVYAVIGTAQGPTCTLPTEGNIRKATARRKTAVTYGLWDRVQIPTPVAMTCTYVNW